MGRISKALGRQQKHKETPPCSLQILAIAVREVSETQRDKGMFCRVQFGNKKKKTRRIRKGEAAEWKENVDLTTYCKGDLVIQVWRKKTGLPFSRFLGQMNLTQRQLRDSAQGILRGWYQLTGRGKQNEIVKGQIFVSLIVPNSIVGETNPPIVNEVKETNRVQQSRQMAAAATNPFETVNTNPFERTTNTNPFETSSSSYLAPATKSEHRRSTKMASKSLNESLDMVRRRAQAKPDVYGVVDRLAELKTSTSSVNHYTNHRVEEVHIDDFGKKIITIEKIIKNIDNQLNSLELKTQARRGRYTTSDIERLVEDIDMLLSTGTEKIKDLALAMNASSDKDLKARMETYNRVVVEMLNRVDKFNSVNASSWQS